MPRVKPEFSYTEPVDTAPELPENFKSQIEKIIRQDAECNHPSVARFLDELKVVLHRFQLATKVRSSAAKGKPTPGEIKRNAKEILKISTKLRDMLDGEAGGLKHYINNGIGNHYSGQERYPNTGKLIRYLNGVNFGCKDFLGMTDDDHQELRLTPLKSNHPVDSMAPNDYLAFSIASLMKEVLKETPTAHTYEGRNTHLYHDGKYAQLLKACFDFNAKGRPGSIRSLMRKALKTL